MASLSALDDRLADLPGCGSFILFKCECPRVGLLGRGQPLLQRRLPPLPPCRRLTAGTQPLPPLAADWCPDCVRCMPAVRQVVAAEGGVLVEVDVGPREGACWRGMWRRPGLDTNGHKAARAG